ncbi:MAG TPA: aminotransferase class V-fold PLP-dependent enzyme [Casimicrobiaceae bacterium]|nr:aminotransferase class V-fold PLP-dependent enzyme [Casimicrobiaceae bacterium]
MPGLLPNVDPDGLLEYSVVYTDRALNHMSRRFQRVMTHVARTLESVYGASTSVVVPGSGTFGMEAVARQFATRKRCLVVRNGWFSYRWSQIFEMGDIPSATTVLKARRVGNAAQSPFAPPSIGEIVAAIDADRPDLVFAPHVETASGIILPDSYLRAIADAVHAVGGMFVLDCIASGTLWVDMKATGVDVLISAPQKGWSSPAGYALVMLGDDARSALDGTTSTSYACDLKKWLSIMDAYKRGGHAYHATMPTDSLARLSDAMTELEDFGFERAKGAQVDLGERVRRLLVERGMPSVAAKGFEAPTVVVSYTDDPGIQSGSRFAEAGLQTAAGVPLQCDEPSGFSTFRIGLFGLDKLRNVGRTVATLDAALQEITADVR